MLLKRRNIDQRIGKNRSNFLVLSGKILAPLREIRKTETFVVDFYLQ